MEGNTEIKDTNVPDLCATTCEMSGHNSEATFRLWGEEPAPVRKEDGGYTCRVRDLTSAEKIIRSYEKDTASKFVEHAKYKDYGKTKQGITLTS